MACCCKSCKTPQKSTASCLGRCDIPKHRCLLKECVRPGPIPKHQGWLYNARDSPGHQLRCGWRPGHVSCSVLRIIRNHRCLKSRECFPCSATCKPRKGCCPNMLGTCSMSGKLPVTCCSRPPTNQPLLRVIRHAGQYTICTKPSSMNNSPSGPNPLKYVLNTDPNEEQGPGKTNSTKYSVEGKFNDYHFDYTSSQASFVIDFTPPEPKCMKTCRPVQCEPCENE